MASRRVGIQRCFYEVLGVDPTADARTIKAAHRKLALKFHPDRNIGNEEEAAEKFKEVQSAYEVLSSEEDRRWYDLHREDILRGGSDGEVEDINLWPFFSPQAYSDFSDGPNGFYTVYSNIFTQIGEFEGVKVPKFGDASMTYQRIKKFYSYFESFQSRRKFTSEEVYDERAAANRWQRNQMRKENSKARNSKKRDWENRVQGLAMFVKRRDPRVRKFLIEQEQRKREEEEKMREYEEEINQLMREKKRLQREEEIEALRQMMEERPEDFVDADVDRLEFECAACRKTFKSENSYESHCKSKKHLTKVQFLREQLQQEEAMMAAASSSPPLFAAGSSPPVVEQQQHDVASETSSFVVVDDDDDVGEDENNHGTTFDEMLAHQISVTGDVDDFVNVEERVHDVIVGSVPLSSDESVGNGVPAAAATEEAENGIDADHLVALQLQQDDILEAVDRQVPIEEESQAPPEEPPVVSPSKAQRRRQRKNRRRRGFDDDEESDEREDERSDSENSGPDDVDMFLQQFRQGKKKKVATKKEVRGDKKRRRRKKEKKNGFDAVPAPTEDTAPLPRCRVCNASFASKSKLFKHLRDMPEHARVNRGRS